MKKWESAIEIYVMEREGGSTKTEAFFATMKYVLTPLFLIRCKLFGHSFNEEGYCVRCYERRK